MPLARSVPPPDVQVIDPANGLMRQDWYDFFAALAQGERLRDYADDTAAKTGGVPLFGLYRTGSTVKVRVTP